VSHAVLMPFVETAIDISAPDVNFPRPVAAGNLG
jgi:hypothetical protein